MNRLEQRILKEDGPLLGLAVYTYNPAFVEMMGLLGYHIVWLELEHSAMSIGQVTDLCRIASGVGLLTMIRIPDARRDSVLKAAECGPDIIDLPMGNSPEDLRDLVEHARYMPEGNRGFFAASRAMRYGLIDSLTEEQGKINRQLCLMSQVETREAVDRLPELCTVSGIDAIFIGPGDLSASLGVTGDINHPTALRAIDQIIETAKRNGKLVAMANTADSIPKWREKGVDIIFCGSDIGCMKMGAQSILKTATAGDSILAEVLSR